MKIKVSKTKQETAVNFSRYFAIILAAKETCRIALSGGSTPKVVFDELAAHFQPDIDWHGVHLYWGDERCVAPNHNDSNYKMTVEHLISKIDIPPENIHRIRGEAAPETEAERYGEVLEKNLPKSNALPEFDLVILGMGDDGHTASIFPHEIELWDSNAHCVVATHPESGQNRISITGQIINNARAVAFLVTGESKAERVKEIIDQEGSYASYPANSVRPESGKLIWFLDEAAAGKIT